MPELSNVINSHMSCHAASPHMQRIERKALCHVGTIKTIVATFGFKFRELACIALQGLAALQTPTVSSKFRY